MKILLLTAYFPPDNGSASHLFFELGAHLSAKGHQVNVITNLPGYHAQGPLDRYRGKLWMREYIAGMNVIRVTTPRLPPRIMIGRALWQFSMSAVFFLSALFLPRHDLIMLYSPPLTLGLTAWALRGLRGTPFILNVQDLFPQSIIDLGLLKNKTIIRLFRSMERFLYKNADAVSVHSAGNRALVLAVGGVSEAVWTIPNWVDTHAIQPGERCNGFRSALGVGATEFIVSFAGILGYSQDLDVVLEAAARLRDQREIFWVIVGDGVEKDRLQTRADEMDLSNVRFVPMQPKEKYPAVLQASDVCLVTLHAEVRTPVVPSKILSIMAAAKPVVAALSLEGDACQLVEGARCGYCVPPGDSQALAEAVRTLYQDEDRRWQMGENGRAYIENHLSLEMCMRQYERLFREVTY